MATAAPTHHPIRDRLPFAPRHHEPPVPQELLESHSEFHERTVELREIAQTFQAAHAYAQKTYERLSFWLTLVTVVLSTIVSGSVFASLATSPSTTAKITVGCLGLLTAVAAALNHSGLFAAQASAHRKALAAFGAVYNEAGQMLVALEGGDISPPQARQTLASLWDRQEKHEAEPPHVSHFKRAHNWAEREGLEHPV
jgi:hypothetical protein